MLTEQVVTECESLGRGPAEHGSGSLSGIERGRERRDLAFHPICTHSLLRGSSFFCQSYNIASTLLYLLGLRLDLKKVMNCSFQYSFPQRKIAPNDAQDEACMHHCKLALLPFILNHSPLLYWEGVRHLNK